MRPYPWHQLPRVSRGDAARAEALGALLGGALLGGALVGGEASVARALRGLLGVEVELRPHADSVTEVDEPALPDVLTAIALEHPEGRFAIELEPWVALFVVDRVLGGEAMGPIAPVALSALERGVLAFVAAKLAAGGARVIDVLSTREGLAAFLGEGPWARASVEARWSGGRALAHVLVTAPLLARRAAPELELPAAVLDATTRLRVTVGRARLSREELASLAEGDVLFADEVSAASTSEGPAWSEATLASARGEVLACFVRDGDAWRCTRFESGAGRRGATVEEATMGDDDAVELNTSDVSEVPIQLSIELGRIELRVREVAMLTPGRVLSARIPVGRAVELRAGDRLVARGELVDIEGELGVRITHATR